MAEQAKINLNTASKSEISEIPGIGDECADIIIDYRQEHGGIRNIEELRNLSGFGPKAIEHLRERATV